MVAYRIDVNAGDLFDGKYSIVRQIGSGNYGNVFKVRDNLGRDYALKLLRLWEVAGELHRPLVMKFEQEYKTGQLACDYLIHSLDFGTVQGNPYLLMEFCSQGDLSRAVGKDQARLPGYAHDILEGLRALHSEGKIHRDMKPENVLIRNNGKAALTDFGVVGEMDKNRRLSEKGWWSKRPKQVQGTPLYMSPEMFDRKGGGVTYLPTVDIWSFGVMMYEMLTSGSFPFGDIENFEDFPKYQERARRGQWDADRLRMSPYGCDWLQIIEHCLAPNYRERYQSALDVLVDLAPMLGGRLSCAVSDRLSRSCAISRIVVTQGEIIGAEFRLDSLLQSHGRMLRAGRGSTNDIVLSERVSNYVSRCHFTLERSKDGGYWVIRDGQWQSDKRRWVPSTNGTYLNATPVSVDGQKVFTGDIITAGEYKLKVE